MCHVMLLSLKLFFLTILKYVNTILAHRPFENVSGLDLGPGGMMCRPRVAKVPRLHAIFRVQNSYDISDFILYCDL